MKKNLQFWIKEFYWYTKAANQTGAVENLYLSTLDFAKRGMLALNHVKWKNIQIIVPHCITHCRVKLFDISNNNPFAAFYGMVLYIRTELIWARYVPRRSYDIMNKISASLR